MNVERTVERVDALMAEHVSPGAYFDFAGLPWIAVRDALKPVAAKHAERLGQPLPGGIDPERYAVAVLAAAMAMAFAYGHAYASQPDALVAEGPTDQPQP